MGMIGFKYVIAMSDEYGAKNVLEAMHWCVGSLGKDSYLETWFFSWDNKKEQTMFEFSKISDYTEFCLRWL